jgi:hypothetical protein
VAWMDVRSGFCLGRVLRAGPGLGIYPSTPTELMERRVETIINDFLAMPLWAKAGVLIGTSVLCGFSFAAGRAAWAATEAWLMR